MPYPTHLTIDNILVPVLPLDFNPEPHPCTSGSPIEVILPVPLHLVSNIEALNDYVSLYLTTSDCGLEDISLSHLPNPLSVVSPPLVVSPVGADRLRGTTPSGQTPYGAQLYPAGYIAMHLWATFSND